VTTRLASVASVLAVAGVAASASILYAREVSGPLPVASERLLYLRTPSIASRAFLTFDALAADVYWIRTIQHYGRDLKSVRTKNRFELLQPLLDLTTTLDPYFNVAYRFGAIFLAIDPPDGPSRPDQAIALLEKGLANNPTRWQYAHDIGFVHYWYTGNYAEAARWFERAASMPGAPAWIRPLAALTRAEGGDRNGARRLLGELSTSDQAYIQAVARRSLAQLQALDAIDELRALVEQYTARTGRAPGSWNDLVRAGFLPGLPADPSGQVFHYDPASGAVTISRESSLWPLPPTLEPR
jgi:tetratricopeptide (TPR) repeat protein